MKRARWLEHLTGSQHVHRFLSRIGSSVSPALATSLDEGALAQYVASLRGGETDTRVLLEVLELLTQGYDTFCTEALPELLLGLANETLLAQEVVGPGLRGVVRWDLTKLGRTNRTLPGSRFVANVPYRSFDTPHNVMLSWLLRDIRNAIERVKTKVGSKRLAPKLLTIQKGCDDALRSSPLSAVFKARAVAPHMLSIATYSKHQGYRAAASLVRRRQRMNKRDPSIRWSLILELLRRNWLQPISDDDLFELYALSQVLDVLIHDVGLNQPTAYGLLGSAIEPAATFDLDGRTTRVFFNRTPRKVTSIQGRYRSVISAHSEIDAPDRRPDIVVLSTDSSGSSRCMFIEVKNAASADYMRESIYKVFGYLYDYELLFMADQPYKAVLYFPSDFPTRLRESEENESGLMLVPDSDRHRLSAALREGLQLT